jgi:hypothetical protein
MLRFSRSRGILETLSTDPLPRLGSRALFARSSQNSLSIWGGDKHGNLFILRETDNRFEQNLIYDFHEWIVGLKEGHSRSSPNNGQSFSFHTPLFLVSILGTFGVALELSQLQYEFLSRIQNLIVSLPECSPVLGNQLETYRSQIDNKKMLYRWRPNHGIYATTPISSGSNFEWYIR